MNYFTYPMKYMKITQSYTGTYSHKKHWYNSKNYKDYPIDDGGKDAGRDGIYCPCDEMVVTEIKGVKNNKVTNTIWLVSTTKVNTPTFNDYAFMTLTHSNDSDFKNIKVGTKFKRSQLIVKEGENVNVATHIHMVFGRGSSKTWITNSNKAVVIKGNCLKPEEVCYIDTSFTAIKNTGGLKWKNIPLLFGTPIKRDEKVNQIEINVNNLRARKSPNGEILGYIKKGIFNILDEKKENNYIWYKIENFWVAYSNKWAKLLLKKEIENDNNKEIVVIKKNIFIRLIEYIKKIFGI